MSQKLWQLAPLHERFSLYHAQPLSAEALKTTVTGWLLGEWNKQPPKPQFHLHRVLEWVAGNILSLFS